MPMYDRRCNTCGKEKIDCLEPMSTPDMECPCGGMLQRCWTSKPSAVIGDEIDITITNGLCNLDGSARRYRSRQEMDREAKKRGYTSYVTHVGAQGSDKSKHTSRWV